MKDRIELQNVAVVLVALPDTEEELELYEINRLVETANGKVVLMTIQHRDSIDNATAVGTGKLEEISSALKMAEIDVVVFCNELSAVQRRNISKALDDIFVIDKTDLILDIFALHATSAEGKKQVELAQLAYSMVMHSEQDYSRQGGGIGTRGPGETQLETNKRIARDKMVRLHKELEQISKRKEVTRKNRKENDVFVVSLVGYTNAGKSTLFNRLTQDATYVDDKLFATLDTTMRKLKLPCGINTVLCDTVGFIRNLPHTLIEAFKSTLEETKNADLILNVCDISDKNVTEHIAVTEQILHEIGVESPIVRVFNKCDNGHFAVEIDRPCVYVSAINGTNIDALLETISSYAMKKFVRIKLKCDIAEAYAIVTPLLNKYNAEFSNTYNEHDVEFDVVINRKYLNIFAKYVTFN